MLNLGRNDRWVDVKESNKSAAKPSNPSSTPSQPGTVISGATPTPRATPASSSPAAAAPAAPPPAAAAPAPSAAPAPAVAPPPAPAPEATASARELAPQPSPEEVAGSKLFVGVNIKLKGVEISNCDVLVIEGQVDATINSKVMEISKPGTLTGTAVIDIAEIHGEFSGELTARKKLVVHGTGRVTGNVRYGKLVVAEGGTVTGEVRQIDQAEARSESKENRHAAD
jgi:cytoskeletal protein CcmA (bactofilin family)